MFYIDFETAQEARLRPEEHNRLLNLMSNITQQIENFPPEGDDIGLALHMTGQVVYLLSVFTSMFSNKTPTPTNISTYLPISTAPVISSVSDVTEVDVAGSPVVPLIF